MSVRATIEGADVAPRPWLSCRGVTKRYGGVLALSRADLDLLPGEVHGVIGPNGAGKSTLVKILAAAIRRDEGTIVLDGDDVDFHDPAAAQHHRLVLMPQEIAVVPQSSVVDNVTLGAEATSRGFRSASGCRRQAQEALDIIGLDVDLSAPAGSLPAAHQRMLMMARAIDRKARLLILDEPTAGLPEHEASMVGEAVRTLMNHQLTVVYVSHHLSEVAELCDRVTCVREGRVTATLTGPEVTKDALVGLLLDTPTQDGKVRRPQARPSRADAATNAAALQLVDVSGSRLDGISMQAGPGQVTAVTGLLGSGVSELVAILVGAARPVAGTYELGGESVSLQSPADALDRGIGYLAGDRARAAFSTLAIRENVSVAALRRWFGRVGLLGRKTERSKVGEYLAQLSVKGDPERPISALSGGNQQRALVARLIAADVRVLVLDEPTVGVDIRARQELWEAVRALADDRTVIVASSEPEELVALADEVVCIRHGRVATVLEGDAVSEHAITQAIS